MKRCRDFCGEITTVNEAARIKKILSKNPSEEVGMLRIPNGGYTTTASEAARLVFETHFPNCSIGDQGSDSVCSNSQFDRGRDWGMAAETASLEGVEWEVDSFFPYKTAAMLQRVAGLIIPYLTNIFRACIATGYTTYAWRRTRVCFIPKPGKSNYEDPKSFRPISLTSFLLKFLEKLCDRYILVKNRLCTTQHVNRRKVNPLNRLATS